MIGALFAAATSPIGNIREFVCNAKKKGLLTKKDCAECGEPFEIDPESLTSHHLTQDGERDYDADAEHVPYELQE